MQPTKAPRQAAGNNQKSPSYLSKVKDELYQLIVADHSATEQEAQEITESLWKFMSPKIAESYWNGVSAGASGRVKPRAPRGRSPERGQTSQPTHS